jgi:hypothetical protein
MRTVKAGVLYFAIVFGAGFVLGPIRLLWAVPRFGERMAELMEAPVMLSLPFLQRGGSSGISLYHLHRPADSEWVASHLPSCWSLNSPFCSGFVVYRSVNTLQAGTLCKERFTTPCLWCLPSWRLSWLEDKTVRPLLYGNLLIL